MEYYSLKACVSERETNGFAVEDYSEQTQSTDWHRKTRGRNDRTPSGEQEKQELDDEAIHKPRIT